MKHIFNKTILAFLITWMSMSPVLVFAGSPTTDAGNAGTHAGNLTTNSLTTSQQILKTMKDYGLDTVAYMLAQMLGQKMTSAIINKATGGGAGDKEQNFVSDFKQFFQQVGSQQLDLLTTDLLASNNPFGVYTAKQIIRSKNGGPLPAFTLQNTLTNGASWQSVSKDLTLAGTDGLDFFIATGMPENTPMGSNLLALQDLSGRIESAEQADILKLTVPGFTPQSKCNMSVNDYKKNAQVFIDAKASEGKVFSDTKQNADGTYSSQQASDFIKQQQQDVNKASGAFASEAIGCLDEMIKNPVATTEKLVNNAGQFAMDNIKQIDGWGQIVTGLFVSLGKSIISTGLASVKSDYGQNKKKNTVSGPESLATQKTTSSGQTYTNVGAASIKVIDLRNDLQPALERIDEVIKINDEYIARLAKVPGRLASLDICLPGPDFIGLEKRLDNYYSRQTDWIQKQSFMGSDDSRNEYQSQVLSFLERDMDIAKAEMFLDMRNDALNIPGAATMRAAIEQFGQRRTEAKQAGDDKATFGIAQSNLQQVVNDVKQSVDLLRVQNPNLPNLVFTYQEWEILKGISPTQAESLVTWAKTIRGNTAKTDYTDTEKRDLVIGASWDVWEYPDKILPNGVWNDQAVDGSSVRADEFLDKKNSIRSDYSALIENIPTDWQLDKIKQSSDSVKRTLEFTDNLIMDCNMVRRLVFGDGVNKPIFETAGVQNDKKAMASYMEANKDKLITYQEVQNGVTVQKQEIMFKTTEVRNAITSPNIFTVDTYVQNQPWCKLDFEMNGSSFAINSTGRGTYTQRFDGNNGEKYICYGDFGYIRNLSGEGNEKNEDKANNFNSWIDEYSNAYHRIPIPNWPIDLYSKSNTVIITYNQSRDAWETKKFTGWWSANTSTDFGKVEYKTVSSVSPQPLWYGKGTTLPAPFDPFTGKQLVPLNPQAGDTGEPRTLFCRFSSVMAAYPKFSSTADLKGAFKQFACSSKWADVTVGEATGMFYVDLLN